MFNSSCQLTSTRLHVCSETKLTVQKADADGVTFAAAAADDDDDDDDEVESDSCDVMHRGDCRVVCLQQQQRQLL